MANGDPVPSGVYCGDLKPGCASPSPIVPTDSPFWRDRKLTGDWNGLRTVLSNNGVSLQVTSTTDLATVVTGGRQQGFLMPYLVDVNLTLDTEKLGVWDDGRVFVDFQQAGSTQQISKYIPDFWGWDALSTGTQNYTELAQYWYEQSFLGDTLNIKFGKIDANAEFALSYQGSNFLNLAAYNPATLSINLPTYPNPAGGVEVLYELTKGIKAKFGFFDGTTNFYNAETGASGAATGGGGLGSFVLNNPGSYFLIAETEGSWEVDGLSGTCAGGWWQQTGNSSAEGVNGTTAIQGPWGLYGSISQELYKPTGGDDDAGLTAFTQFGWSPPENNPVQWSLMSGMSWEGVIPGRPLDTVGALTAWAQFSDDPSVTTSPNAGEFIFEAFYNIQLTPQLNVQPDVQFINQPSDVPGDGVPNAVILTVRIAIAF